MSKSCQQQIDSVLGKEHRVGTRQIIIEAHDPHMWFVEAINNTQWPQPEALHASNNGWTTDINQRIYFRLKREAMQWFNMHDHLLPQSEAEEQQHAKNLCKTPIINDEPLPIKSSNLVANFCGNFYRPGSSVGFYIHYRFGRIFCFNFFWRKISKKKVLTSRYSCMNQTEGKICKELLKDIQETFSTESITK